MSTIEAPAPTTTVTTADILNRAADVLEEWGWTQHANARRADGTETHCYDSGAVSFCLYGAAQRAGIDLGVITGDGWERFGRFNDEWFNPAFGDGDTSLVAWNNAPNRTKAEVVARLREAAQNT